MEATRRVRRADLVGHCFEKNSEGTVYLSRISAIALRLVGGRTSTGLPLQIFRRSRDGSFETKDGAMSSFSVTAAGCLLIAHMAA
jgi:hypothetical protein